MKKIIAMLLLLAMVFSMVACGSELPSKAGNKTPAEKTLNESLENKPSKSDVAEKETRPPEPETTPTEEVTAPETEPVTEPILEDIDMGEAGEVIYLSELEFDKRYVYHLNEVQDKLWQTFQENENTTFLDVKPHVLNNRDDFVVHLVLQVDDMEPEETLIFRKSLAACVPLAQFQWQQTLVEEPAKAKTLRITMSPANVLDVLNEDKVIKLSAWEVDADIDMETKNYLLNDTESTIVVQVSSEEDGFSENYELLPSEVLESSFMYNAKIIEIK